MSDDAATRVYLEGGAFVRASEAIGQIADMADDPTFDGWVPVEDPGDGRSKLIRAHRILWLEQEQES